MSIGVQGELGADDGDPNHPVVNIGDGFTLSYNVNLSGLSLPSNCIYIEEPFAVDVKSRFTCCCDALLGL